MQWITLIPYSVFVDSIAEDVDKHPPQFQFLRRNNYLVKVRQLRRCGAGIVW